MTPEKSVEHNFTTCSEQLEWNETYNVASQ